jgi:hypothetical protein
MILNVCYDSTLIEEVEVDKFFGNQMVTTYIGRNALNILSPN